MPGLAAMKAFFNEKGIDAALGGKIAKARRNIHFFKSVPDGCEIVILRQAGATAVLAPLMGDEACRRYDVGKAGDDPARHVTAAAAHIIDLAIRRIAPLICGQRP